MPDLDLTVANYGRPRVSLPTTRLVNAYIEESKGGPTASARIPRPGLRRVYTLGVGPILRQFQQPGLFNGDLFSVSGAELYENDTLIGGVPYGLNPRMVAANDQLAIVSGGALYVYQGGTLELIEFFDDGSSRLPPFSGIAVLYDIFIFPVAGSDQFYFSNVGDAKTINALNFSAAQTSPDPIVEVQVCAEELMFFGSTSVEFWDFTGQLNAPFALSQGRTYIRGCAAQGSVVKADNAMFWVADDLSVYRSGTVPMKISTPFIDDRLRRAGSGVQAMTAFQIGIEGHEFYVINLPSLNESYAYDCATQEWAQWGTQQPFQAEPGLFCAGTSTGQASTAIFAGSATDGAVWTVNASEPTDDGTGKRVVVSASYWHVDSVMRCNNVAIQMVRGVGNDQSPNPIVEMRFSDDVGRTWSSWIVGHLGMRGEYDYQAQWRYLGLMSQPGRLFEFSVTDPVNFTVEGGLMNQSRI